MQPRSAFDRNLAIALVLSLAAMALAGPIAINAIGADEIFCDKGTSDWQPRQHTSDLLVDWKREISSLASKVDFTWSAEHDVALSLFARPHLRRTFDAFGMVARKRSTLLQINNAIPPSDPNWTWGMLSDLQRWGMVKSLPCHPETYALTAYGKKIQQALKQIPEPLKREAHCIQWSSRSECDRLLAQAPPPPLTLDEWLSSRRQECDQFHLCLPH